MAGSVFDIPATYSGLLDDVVDRHRITSEIDDEFFNRMILRNVFFSGQVILNDGYLFSHPAALKQLMTEDSLLRVMIKNDVVKVIARKEDPEGFANTPVKNAKNGMTSNQEVVARPEWPEIQKELFELSEGLFHAGKIDPFPKREMNKGFTRLFERIFDKRNEDLGLRADSPLSMRQLQDILLPQEKYQVMPRTVIEDSLLDLRDDGRVSGEDVVAIMNIANQCYHYNFAMCLSDGRATPVVADTTIGPAFDELLMLDEAVDADLGDIPILTIPDKFPIENGAIFDGILDWQSKLARSKHLYLQKMNTLFDNNSNQTVEGRKQELTEATEEYRRYLAEHFAKFIGLRDLHPKKHSMLTFGLGKVGSAIGADSLMLAANLASKGRVSSFVHKMIKPMQDRVVEVAISPRTAQSERFFFKASDIKPRFASLAFDPDAISHHVSGIPVFPGE